VGKIKKKKTKILVHNHVDRNSLEDLGEDGTRLFLKRILNRRLFEDMQLTDVSLHEVQ